MDDYEQAEVQYAAASNQSTRLAGTALSTSRPPTAGRSANTIIKEAAAYVACAEALLPAIIGVDPQILCTLISSALGLDLDPATAVALETTNGIYLSCRLRQSCERILVILKGKQFLAPSSKELQNILDEAMSLMILRNCDSGAAEGLSKRFPVASHPEMYRAADRIVVITLVKDHLESCFQRVEPEQFHYQVAFSDLWSATVQLNFFSLRHFIETVENGATPLSHPFRKWLFLFAYQGRLQSTSTGGNERLQKLCEEAISDEAIAIVWERTAELSKGPQYN